MGGRSAFPLNVVKGRDKIGNGRPDGQRPDAIGSANPSILLGRLLRLTASATTPILRASSAALGLSGTTLLAACSFPGTLRCTRFFTSTNGIGSPSGSKPLTG